MRQKAKKEDDPKTKKAQSGGSKGRASLRKKAEEKLLSPGNRLGNLKDEDIHKVIHELRVYQVELEMQNEELRNTQDKLRNSRDNLERLVREKTREVVEQSRILESFFRHTQTGLVFLDRQFNFIRVNDAYARVCRREVSDFAGHNHFIDYPSDELREKFLRVVDTKEPYAVYARPFVFPDHPEWGETYWDLAVSPILTEDGETEFLVFSLLDVTQRTRAERELAQHKEHLEELVRVRTEELRELSEEMVIRNMDIETANKELEAFSYSVSHDLRAPLRAVSGFAKILVDEYADRLDGQCRDYLERIHHGSEKMRQLMDDLLYLSRVSKQEMRPMKVDLSNLARSVLRGFAGTAPERRVEISIMEGLTAGADKMLLDVVFSNLLGNAWKFTSRTGNARIEFGATKSDASDQKVVYFIRDNGAGFDPAYKDKLFRPFQRIHSEREFPGSGIGLAISERIIRRHGGRIWIEGETGKGATVYFTLGDNLPGTVL